MERNNPVDFTPRRKLNFSVEENNEEEEIVQIDNGINKIHEGHSNVSEEKIPKLGMEFDSEETAYIFYNAYAKEVGFSIRRHSIRKDINGRITKRVFCCSWQGRREKDKRAIPTKARAETRNGCNAMMEIDFISGRYKVEELIIEHNGHDLVSPLKVKMLRSHRSMAIAQASQINDIESSGIAPKAGFSLMVKQAGGRENVGFIFEDYKNYLRSKRTVEMKMGDTGGVLEYLQEKQSDDPNFFYAIQVDEDDLICNILWVDAQMKVDYAHFGDVVCFDTTYRKNKDGRPLALFVGTNHHKQTVVFGAALLYDETARTFMWLFDTFIGAMSGKKPVTILTDQDAAMAKALMTRWPQTYHRLCIWHIYQNAATHLSHVFASNAGFASEFSSCVYDFEEEDEFLKVWQNMLDKYELHTNEWLEKMFKIREKWALVYGRQIFCADMITTQRSESMNSVLRRYVSYKHNLLQFFQHFDRLIEDRRYKELQVDFKSQSIPVVSFSVEILKHAATIYTHEVFNLFQNEVRKAYDSRVELNGASRENCQYKVSSFGRNYEHTVIYISSQSTISCSCRKFEFAGILCSHALKVLSLRNIVRIPELYIKKRWTKKAKKTEVKESGFGVEPNVSMDENEEKKMIGSQYKELCSLTNQLVTRAALTAETFRTVKIGLITMIEEVDTNLENRKIVRLAPGSRSIIQQSLVSRVVESQMLSSGVEKTLTTDEETNILDELTVKGWKNKEKKGTKSGKRQKSGLEMSTRKKSQKNQNTSFRSDAITQRSCNLDNINNSVIIGTSMTQLLQEQLSRSLPQTQLNMHYTPQVQNERANDGYNVYFTPQEQIERSSNEI